MAEVIKKEADLTAKQRFNHRLQRRLELGKDAYERENAAVEQEAQEFEAKQNLEKMERAKAQVEQRRFANEPIQVFIRDITTRNQQPKRLKLYDDMKLGDLETLYTEYLTLQKKRALPLTAVDMDFCTNFLRIQIAKRKERAGLLDGLRRSLESVFKGTAEQSKQAQTKTATDGVV